MDEHKDESSSSSEEDNMSEQVKSTKSESLQKQSIIFGTDVSKMKTAFSLLKEENQNETFAKDLYNGGMHLVKEARDGNVDKVVDLLCRGVPFVSDSTGVCALHFAAYQNSEEIVELLLKGGCFHGLKNRFERTSLHIAAQMNHVQVLKTLLAFGADQDATDVMKMTPLHWACENGNVACVKLLLLYGAKSDVVDIFGRTPTDVAKDRETAMALDLHMSKLKTTNNSSSSIGEMVVGEAESHEEKVSSEEESSEDSFDESFKTDRQNSLTKLDSSPKTLADNDKDPMELLREHGIQMLEPDKVTTVHSAVESGRQIVLTEAGKLALDEVSTSSPPQDCLPESVIVQNGRKRIKIDKNNLKKFEFDCDRSFLDTLEPSTSFRYFKGKLYSEQETDNLKILLLSAVSKLRREGRMLEVFSKRKFHQANIYQHQLLSLIKNKETEKKNQNSQGETND